MTQSEFNTLCQQHAIAPSVALENEDLCEALQNRDDDKVRDILTNEF